MGSETGLWWSLSVATLLIFHAATTVRGDALVTGTVFCDQCRDGGRSLFDYPLRGATVSVACVGGAMTAYKEVMTNWVGGYSVRFKGSLDLNRCYARVARGPERCGANAGPAQGLRFLFRLFGMEMYTVSPLLSQPAVPMRFCRNAPVPPSYRPPHTPSPPMVPLPPPSAPVVHHPPQPVPFLNASACSFELINTSSISTNEIRPLVVICGHVSAIADLIACRPTAETLNFMSDCTDDILICGHVSAIADLVACRPTAETLNFMSDCTYDILYVWPSHRLLPSQAAPLWAGSSTSLSPLSSAIELVKY